MTAHEPLQLDTFYIGDVLKVLKTFTDNCIRCVITSPPYYGLREYQTAKWIGGDENCDHLRIGKNVSIQTALAKSTLGGQAAKEVSYAAKKMSKNICGKCGAVRVDEQIGLEKTPELYIEKLVKVFHEVKRILTADGSLWLNIGDSYASSTMTKHGGQRKDRDQTAMSGIRRTANSIGLKPKDLIGTPWMLAFALRADGWYLRSDIIWKKENPMPESVNDRPSKAHEYIFLLTKSPRYYYDAIAIRQPLAESVLNDKRLYDEDYKTGRPDRNYPGQSSPVAGLLKRKSGNLERKDRPGAPEDNGKHQAGSVPWEGMTANKKSVWSIATKPFTEAHFATFPVELIIDPIKAGTSEYGKCGKCSKPYTRITEKELKPTAKASPGTIVDYRDEIADDNDQSSNRVKSGHLPGFYNDYTTTGWKPSCTCHGAEVIPDIVLDPFMGAGTTALVAKKLGRNFIGIELNQKYVKDIAVPRLQKELGMFYTPKIIES